MADLLPFRVHFDNPVAAPFDTFASDAEHAREKAKAERPGELIRKIKKVRDTASQVKMVLARKPLAIILAEVAAETINTPEMLQAGMIDLTAPFSALLEEATRPTPGVELPSSEDVYRVLVPFVGRRIVGDRLVAEMHEALHTAFPHAWPEVGKIALRERLTKIWFEADYPEEAPANG